MFNFYVGFFMQLVEFFNFVLFRGLLLHGYGPPFI